MIIWASEEGDISSSFSPSSRELPEGWGWWTEIESSGREDVEQARTWVTNYSSCVEEVEGREDRLGVGGRRKRDNEWIKGLDQHGFGGVRVGGKDGGQGNPLVIITIVENLSVLTIGGHKHYGIETKKMKEGKETETYLRRKNAEESSESCGSQGMQKSPSRSKVGESVNEEGTNGYI